MPHPSPKPLTSFCVNCDFALAEALARLPAEDVETIVSSVRMLVRIYSIRRGLEPPPRGPSPVDVGENVIQLRLPPR